MLWAREENCCRCLVAKSCLKLCNPMDCSLPGSSVHRISPGKNPGDPVAISFSRGSSPPRDQILISCIGRRILLPLSHRGNLCTKTDVVDKPDSNWVRAAWDTIFKKAKLVLSSPAAPFSVSVFLLPVYYPPRRPSCKMLDSRTQFWAPTHDGFSSFIYLFFWPHYRAYGILVPSPEIEPMPPAVEVLTPGPPGKSLSMMAFLNDHSFSNSSHVWKATQQTQKTANCLSKSIT